MGRKPRENEGKEEGGGEALVGFLPPGSRSRGGTNGAVGLREGLPATDSVVAAGQYAGGVAIALEARPVEAGAKYDRFDIKCIIRFAGQCELVERRKGAKKVGGGGGGGAGFGRKGELTNSGTG